MLSTGITHDDLMNKYAKEHANLSAILISHAKQMIARQAMRDAFPDATFCFMSDYITNHNDFDAVLVLGGDNSFTKVSHHIEGALFMGINSDPERSLGHLTTWTVRSKQSAVDLKNILDVKFYHVEKWTRLGASVDGVQLPNAISELFLGEKMRDMMSRHVIEFADETYE